MTIRIDGTNTTTNPGITGADTDTGLQFGTDEVNLLTGGTTRATVQSDGDILLGTTANHTFIRPYEASTGNLIISSDQGATGTGGSDLIFKSRGTERARIRSGGGLTFNGDTSTDNALDDYEQGVWSSTVSGVTASTNSVTGIYTKVGNAVFIHGYVEIAGKTSGSGNASFTLPFAPKQTTTVQYGMQTTLNNINTSFYFVAPYNGGTSAFFYNSAAGPLSGAAMGNGAIAFNGAYITNT